MKLPFVSRDRYDDTKAMLEKRIAELESERQKLWDVLAYNAIHMTIFNKDLIPAPEPEPEPEDENTRIELEEERRLASVRRTRPSQLPVVMEEIMAKRAQRAAASAVPPIKPEVQKLFDNAKSQIKQ